MQNNNKQLAAVMDSIAQKFTLSWGVGGCIALIAIIFVLAPYSDDVVLAPIQDRGFWYNWQLAEPTFWTRFTAWGGYALHQVSLWAIIYYAQSQKPKYTKGLQPFNFIALGINIFFIFLHIVQTKIWYDATAQDVHEATSFGSVTLMLVFILIMENKRRGMFFSKRAPFMEELGSFLRRYHGYYFSWAIVYTFWYHPIEIGVPHVMGFAYMFLLLLQGSLFYTSHHVNRRWTFLLETFVIIHGVTTAIVVQGEVAAARFFFGFMIMLLVTQLYGIRHPKWLPWLIGVSLLVGMAVFYQFYTDTLNGPIQIPLFEYVLVAFFAFLIWPIYKLSGRVLGRLSNN